MKKVVITMIQRMPMFLFVQIVEYSGILGLMDKLRRADREYLLQKSWRPATCSRTDLHPMLELYSLQIEPSILKK